VATKQELAESMTISQLRALADDEGVDLSGASAKDEIVERVVAGVSKETLQEAAGETGTEGETSTSGGTTPGSTPSVPNTGEGDQAQPVEPGDHLLTDEDESLTPPAEQEGMTQAVVPAPVARIAPSDTEALARAGQSAADAELRLPHTAAGEPRIVKQRPEMPTLNEVTDSLGAVVGPPDVTVTVTDVTGEEKAARVRPDDAAMMAQRVASQQSGHPAHISKGHWSNPTLTEMTDEEKEADAKAYADRVGA
jgi:hypothetical protein